MTVHNITFNELSRAELQRACKQAGIKANSKTIVLIRELEKTISSSRLMRPL
jgi:hypothetical protein